MSQGMTPDFAAGLCAMMLDGIQREAECTKRVLAAVPDDKSDYRPDPNARTARELAWHIANTDVQFLDGIADLNFSMESPEHKPQTLAEIVKWYDENMKRGLTRVAGMTPEQLLTPIEFFGAFKPARCGLPRFPEQSQHSSPGRTKNLSATNGIEGPLYLRRQLRRALVPQPRPKPPRNL